MKKTTRLTALLLALVLLLGTLSASATEAGIPIEDFDFGTYSSIRTTAEEGGAPDITDCANCPEYCERVTYMLEGCQTAQERYEYLMTLYVPEGEEASAEEADLILEYTLLHYYFCHLENPDDYSSYAVCVCDFPMAQPEKYQPGELSAHTEADCPWKFENMPVEEQYSKICLLSTEARAPYLAKLTKTQAEALETYTAQQNGTLSYPCEEKPEYCQYSVYSQMTASEIYDYFNAIYDDGNGEISDLYAAMMLHYGEYHPDSNLICTCGKHPLPLPEYEIGDISAHEKTCPWHFANLTVPEQYDVICLLSEEEQPAYYKALRPDQEAALKDYIAGILGGHDCEYANVVAMNGYERYAYMKNLYETTLEADGTQSWAYTSLHSHLANEHASEGLVCNCLEFDIANPDYAYGSVKHTGRKLDDGSQIDCPWHFNQLTVAEQYRIIKDLDEQTAGSYTLTLSQDQVAALREYMDTLKSDSTVENVTTVPKNETTGAAAEITVPANVFGQGVDYIMNAEETTLTDAEQAAVAEAGGSNVLAVYDISFNDASSGAKINPVNGKVALTFTIETAKVIGDELRIIHLKDNGDGTYTAEVMGTFAVDRTKDVQTVTVQASEFSTYLAESGFPNVGGCENFDCDYYFSLTTPIAQYNYLMGELWDEEGIDMETFLFHLGGYHEGALEAICTCYVPLYAPGSPEHEVGCPWHGTTATLADYYGAYKNLGTAGKAQYLKGLDDVTLEKMGRINLTSYTAAAADSNEVAISVPTGAFSEDYLLSAASTALSEEMQTALNNKAAEVGEESMDVVSAFDISFGNLATEAKMNPAENAPVQLTFKIPTSELNLVTNEDGTTQEMYLTVFHMAEDGETVVPEVVSQSVAVDPTGEYQEVTIDADAFSIYAVIGTYDDNWNYNNYQITMTVGDSLQVATSTGGNNYTYSWSIVSGGDADAFTLTNANSRTATIGAIAPGKITLQCRITGYYNTTTETMVVEALPSVGDSVDDDIIFYNIDKDYTVGDTEYENTYGPYVMKIRFEDTEGNVLKYADGTTVGDDYYVFDSEASIDKYTFSADAPDGYTYSGAFFYWTAHNDYDGPKVYVTAVDRVNSNTATGSHLYYSGNHDTSGEGRWTYQASGVLHVVYAPIDEVFTVVFKDHCGYDLANYALPHNDSGVKFPSGYVQSISTMATETIPAHHNVHDMGTEFEGSWIVTGGGNGIDGTYTTSDLKSNITKWTIKSNITITAQCSEPEVTINYTVIPSDGSYGLVDLNDSTNAPQVAASETVLVVNGNVVGATAIPKDGYELEGWYVDAAGTIPVNTDWLSSDGTVIIPQRIDNDNNADTVGKYEAATYYAKFVEKTVTINYVVVDPRAGGDVDLNDGTANLVDSTSETLQVFSGNAVGATAVAAANYKFVGWYNNEECSGTPLSTKVSYVPAKVDGKNVAATYYAKFELDVADLTIRKSVDQVGDKAAPDDSFEFTVVPGDGKAHTYKVYNANNEQIASDTVANGETITLKKDQYAVVEGITIGSSYKITENLTSAQSIYYTAAQSEITGTIGADGNTAAFVNTYSTGKLKITKRVEKEDYSKQTFSFTVNGQTYPISVPKAESGNVHTDSLEIDLPVGAFVVSETPADGYNTTYSTEGGQVSVKAGQTTEITVTNTAIGTRSVSAVKVWNDNDNRLKVRPEKVTVNLLQNGTVMKGKSEEMTDSYTWNDLPKYDADGNLYQYTVTEDAVAYYAGVVTGNMDNGFTVTNTIQTGSLTIVKTVTGADDETFLFKVTGPGEYENEVVIKGAGSVTITGLAAGGKYTVTEDTNWSWRYEPDQKSKEVTITTSGTRVEFTNTKDKHQWIDGNSYAENSWNADGTITGTGDLVSNKSESAN